MPLKQKKHQKKTVNKAGKRKNSKHVKPAKPRHVVTSKAKQSDKTSRVRKSPVVVDLTSTKDYEGPLIAAVKNEALDLPTECKFVIDKQKNSVVDVPLYKPSPKIKPRSVTALLDGLRCHSNLIPPTAVDNRVPKAAITTAEKRARREAKVAQRRLRSGCKKVNASKSQEPWTSSDNAPSKKRKVPVLTPLPADPVLSLPMSYNPDPNSIGLRGVVKEAASVLTTHDHKLEKVRRVAEAIRKAKPLSFREQLAEMSAGLFGEDENEDEKEEEEAGGDTVNAGASVKKPARKLTKAERKKRKRDERMRLRAKERRKKNNQMQDFFRLRTIRSEVAAEAARRSALQSVEAQKIAAQKRLTAIWHRRVLRQATITANRYREAAAIIEDAPAVVVGDSSDVGLETGKSLRLIAPRSKNLLFERFTNVQRRGLLLDYRSMEGSRRATHQRKRHGFKVFEIDR